MFLDTVVCNLIFPIYSCINQTLSLRAVSSSNGGRECKSSKCQRWTKWWEHSLIWETQEVFWSVATWCILVSIFWPYQQKASILWSFIRLNVMTYHFYFFLGMLIWFLEQIPVCISAIFGLNVMTCAVHDELHRSMHMTRGIYYLIFSLLPWTTPTITIIK